MQRNIRVSLPSLAELGSELVHVNWIQKSVTIAMPLLCVGAYIWFAVLGWWVLAVVAVMAFSFFSYGSTSHDLVHGNLDLPNWLNNALLSVIELLRLRSGHAYRATHLFHHGHFPHSDDVEAAAAGRSWLASLFVFGPVHQPGASQWETKMPMTEAFLAPLSAMADRYCRSPVCV